MKNNDYKTTLFLPQTAFPMKGGLPRKEPDLLERWRSLDLWKKLRDQSFGREKFVLHDGPPYANGPIHIGTAMNKILKDMINRSYQMLGRDAHYIPGWDCHGLPIEWQIEQEYRKSGKSKDEIPVTQFREECRAYATHWIAEQMKDFKRLGVLGDWDSPYLTMSFPAEAQIVRELGKFLLDGSLYKGAKPVMWSPVEKTALAEAEVEYKDISSTAIYVRFPITQAADNNLVGSSVVIWTTTPWTMPGNQAVAFGKDMDYGHYTVENVAESSLMKEGERIIIAASLAERFFDIVQVESWSTISSCKGVSLEGVITQHPLYEHGYPRFAPLFHADFVSVDQGTGFVHVAPGHGADDFDLGQKHQLEVLDTVDDDGCFLPNIPLFAGDHVYKVNPKVLDALQTAGRLAASEEYIHSYPHSWRSKKPVIFRNTPQWFISMESTGLRETALDAIDATRWVPETGRNRIRSMVESRPDWCVSRQRAWGVPIPVFINKHSGEPLRDPEVVERTASLVEQEGADVWFTEDWASFLGPTRDPDDYTQVKDILDVWFDSGSTHSFVLENEESQRWPADLYLEGTDQHRGCFHSSLLEACGTRGRAPYNEVLTHGFVMDGAGKKMSKSVGNVVAPQKIIEQNGADILRLWVANTDYTEDMRIGPEIVKGMVDMYRRLRNTFRYLLGNLSSFEESERLPIEQMPELERWVLHRISELDVILKASIADYSFHSFFSAAHNFCASDLSAFYFDIRKDVLYCDSPTSMRRRAVRTVLDRLFYCLTTWLAPALVFTSEEAWLSRFPSSGDSVHLQGFPEIPSEYYDKELADRWRRIREIRRVINGALEVERAEKRIGSSLEASVRLYLSEKTDADLVGSVDMAELTISSEVVVATKSGPEGAYSVDEVKGVSVEVSSAQGEKCARCWQFSSDVGTFPGHPDLCKRCYSVIEGGALQSD